MATLTVPVQPKSLNTVITNKPAPRYDGKNLLIMIYIGQGDAIFHCQAQENVGTHKTRHVRFQANTDCRLNFSNAQVFGVSYVDLIAGTPEDLKVSDTTHGVETVYSVTTGNVTPMMQRLADPRIFVP